MRKTLLLASLVAFCGTLAAAQDYYISSKPGSGAGTKENPFGMADLPGPDTKLTRALTVLQPGDTLWFKGGEYALRTGPVKTYYGVGYLRPARSGTPEKRISFKAMPGERVVLTDAGGGQPAFGNGSSSYVTYEGFIVDGSFVRTIARKGAEVAYCEIIGRHVDSADNHDGIRIENADGARIHHCIIRGVTGKSNNSAGIKVYKSQNIIVEDNYIFDNTVGIFDKDSGVNNTYRRNYIVRNKNDSFYGNNQGKPMSARIQDNVMDDQVNLHYLCDGTEVHDNLVLSSTLASAWAGSVWNSRVWNNIVVSGKPVTAYSIGGKQPVFNEGEKKHVEYLDHNVYTAPPNYAIGSYEHKVGYTLAQMRAHGFEKASQVVPNAAALFADEKSYELLPKWQKAGRDGSAPGPGNVALILDAKRYGPEGRGYKSPAEGGEMAAAGSGAPPWLVESFEGVGSKGWGKVWGAWGGNITTDEAGAPPGGGRQAYRQIWNEGKGWSGLGLNFGKVKGMRAKFGAGSELYMRYFLKYDKDFEFGSSTGFKQIIIQSDSIVHDRLYFCIHGKAAHLGLIFQITKDTSWLNANVNGGPYTMPKGRWVEFEWYVKVSPESEKKGVLKGWVDGKLRWDYSGLATIKSGSYVSLTLNPTFNQTIQGPKQKRYWDLFSMGPARMGGRKPPAASPGAGRPSGSRRFEVDEATAKARSDEAKAAELYRAARAAERAGMTDLARRLFKRLREEHPGSALAEKAKARL